MRTSWRRVTVALMTSKARRIAMGTAAIAALGLGGAAIANATSGSGDDRGDHHDGPDQAITGTTGDQAKAAAVRALGSGQAMSVEATDEAAPAAYEVKVTRDDGQVIEVQVAKDFDVVHQQLDD